MTGTRTHIASRFTSAGTRWFKSSYSDGSGNNCIEIADLTATAHVGVAIRDSKDPHGPALLVDPAAPNMAFIQGVRHS
ncbi:DUF397 domain-containing protein [Streptomyces sp. NPDC002573]|uniref:DUF397 domain-containing protein n=1 Tax=Streptomyces sp. NPDC002573 TaxID=3364651 RepID=UPI0036853DE1